MRKFTKIISCLFAVALTAVAFVGCGGENPDDDFVNVTINEMNGSELREIEVLKGVPVPESGFTDIPKNENAFFDGWYLDEECTQSATGAVRYEDFTLYAGYVDYYKIPFRRDNVFKFEDYFDVDISAAYNTISGKITLMGSIAPKYDFTGELSSDKFEIQLDYFWLSDENITVGYISKLFTLYKSNNFTLTDINAVLTEVQARLMISLRPVKDSR